MGFFPLNPSLSAGPEGTGHSQEKTGTYPQETLFSADPEEALLSVHIVFSLTPLSGPWGCFQSTDRKCGLFLGSLPHCWSKPMNTIHSFVFSLLSHIQSLCSTLQFPRKDVVPELEVFQGGGRNVNRKLWERVVMVVWGSEGVRASAGAPLRLAGPPAAQLECSGRPSQAWLVPCWSNGCPPQALQEAFPGLAGALLRLTGAPAAHLKCAGRPS